MQIYSITHSLLDMYSDLENCGSDSGATILRPRVI